VRKQGDSKESALVAVEAALEKKALEPVLIDVGAEASYTDYILIVSARSDRQVQAIADHIVEKFVTMRRRRPLGVEGVRDWVLIDFGDLIVHVFHHPVREFYDLEGMWIESPRVPLAIPEEARIQEPVY
jgi:ribosome-associated protein